MYCRRLQHLSLVALIGLSLSCSRFDENLLNQERALNLPPRPDIPDGGDADVAKRAFAWDVIGFSEANLEGVGLNLDGLDTTEATPERECQPSTGETLFFQDGPDGLDNNFTSFLSFLDEHAEFVEEPDWKPEAIEDKINQFGRGGKGTTILWIENWNGEANDSRIKASILRAIDGTSEVSSNLILCGEDIRRSDDPSDCDDPVLPPLAEDPQWVNVETLIESRQPGESPISVPPNVFFVDLGASAEPIFVDDDAYIADGAIVMDFPKPGESGPFELSEQFFLPDTTTADDGRPIPLQLRQGKLFAQLTNDFQVIERGLIAGRFGVDDLNDPAQRCKDDRSPLEKMLAAVGVDDNSRQLLCEFSLGLADLRNGDAIEDEDTCFALSFSMPFKGVITFGKRADGSVL